MSDGGAAAFLQQAQRNNWQRYLASLSPTARAGWDLCVITANDPKQAAMYGRQLEWRREAGLLPGRTGFIVLPDPPFGRGQFGSGAATLHALSIIMADGRKALLARAGAAIIGELRADDRILIIHAGGDATGIPHCSATGKLFARLPRELPDGRASTIFDELLISLSGLAGDVPPGVLVASGDVLLVFDHLQLAFRRGGAIGVAAAAPAATAGRHGVYVTGDDGRFRVRAYLHRPDPDELARWAAMGADGTVQVDTGLVWFDRPTAGRLSALADQLPDAGMGLHLYGDLLLPLADATAREDYLANGRAGPAMPPLRAVRSMIWQQLRGIPFTVERLQPAAFVHFGASWEYWQRVAGDAELAAMCGWRPEGGADGRPVLINAELLRPAEHASSPALIVDSVLAGPVRLEGAGIVANVQTAAPLRLGADLVLHQLPVDGGHVTRLYGLHDDPRRPAGDPAATFLNRPWAEWLAADPALATLLWPDLPAAERTLWNARLYPLCADREQSLALALALSEGPVAAARRTEWAAAPRLSLAESYRRADPAAILAETAAVEDHVAGRRFYRAVEAEQPAVQAKVLLGALPGAAARRAELAAGWFAAADPIVRLRGYAAVAVATGDARWEDRAFATLAEMIEQATPRPTAGPRPGSPRAQRPVAPAGAVRVHAAARIDFGGGWTDTPPYSIERGGTVLNAAVTLRGRHPIVVEAAPLAEPRLILESRDIAATSEPATVGEVLAYADPADPFALLKAAVVLAGFVSPADDPGRPLRQVFAEAGAGLHLSTQTFIPRGSGLGTSSIMAGAVLAALARWKGTELTAAQLFDQVLCLEQMLTTGGGWQDQVGGLTGGIKLVTTGPGLPQAIRVAPVPLSAQTAADLTDRLLLVYTGQQRLAKNLLRNVMIRWMVRDPEMVWIQSEIARLALAMRDALSSGDLDAFGVLLGRHWVLNKRMDPGCTNPFIDDLFDTLTPYINGGKLAGAGGGGYAMVIARSAGAARDLAAALAARYPGTPVGVWPCAVPEIGLKIESQEREA